MSEKKEYLFVGGPADGERLEVEKHLDQVQYEELEKLDTWGITYYAEKKYERKVFIHQYYKHITRVCTNNRYNTVDFGYFIHESLLCLSEADYFAKLLEGYRRAK
jgi:hypothetical protein